MPKGLAVGVALGVVGLGLARFAFVPPDDATHYHTNWAVFVDGERLDLTDERFMEDVSSCTTVDGQVTPQSRVHMHDGDMDVVHVHQPGATWGHLMLNLGIGIGEGYVITPDGERLFNDADRRLKFVLNDGSLSSVHNELITSEDRLLISYGPESLDDVARTQFPQVAHSATEFNTREDPPSCSGGHEPLSIWDRLRGAFWG